MSPMAAALSGVGAGILFLSAGFLLNRNNRLPRVMKDFPPGVRPIGVTAICVFFGLLSLLAISRLKSTGLVAGFLYGVVAARLWKLKKDGRYGAMTLAAVFFVVCGLIIVRHFRSESVVNLQLGAYEVAYYFAVLILVVPVSILGYLQKSEVAALFKSRSPS
jgi:hypothetical protein